MSTKKGVNNPQGSKFEKKLSSKSKQDVLFGDDDKKGSKDDINSLKINEDFAKKFEHNKRRELLEKGQDKYGKALIEGEKEESSSEEEEDDEGELINQKVEEKFLQTIAMIRSNDPKMKEVKEDLFVDEDFEEDQVKSKTSKKLTYKDQLRENALKGRAEYSSDEDSENS